MLSINRQLMSKLVLIIVLPLSAQIGWAGNRDAVVGGALGGVIGSIVGSQIGGRDGAVVGAGIGAAAGVAIAGDNQRHDYRGHDRYVGSYRRDDYRNVRHVHHREHHDRGNYRHLHRDRGYYADRGRHDAYQAPHYRHDTVKHVR